jgi:hypothetical protein
MNNNACGTEDDINEESSCSDWNQNVPDSSPKGGNEQEEKEMRDLIIKQEERNVRKARLFVIAAIIAIAVAVSTAIYIFAAKSDQDTFELEVSSNRHILCCSIVIATNDALTVTPTALHI